MKPGCTKYTPNVAVVALRNRTIARETAARFDSEGQKKKAMREQVGPHSYDPTRFHSIEHVHRNPRLYRGKFTRDESDRGPSISKRDVKPGPFESEMRKERQLEEKRLNKMLVEEFLNTAQDS